MRYLVLLIFLFSQNLFADHTANHFEWKKSEGWALGVGLGVENDFDNATVLDIKTPTLFSVGESRYALLLSIESKDVGGAFNEEDYSIVPIHLMIDWSTPTYKDLIRTYMRLGAGTVLVNEEALYPQDQFFNVQFQLGVEVVAAGGPNGFGVFFMQAMANVPGIRNPPVTGGGSEIFDGTTLSLGYRLYF